MKSEEHIPVLREAVAAYLAPKSGEHYLDLTAGYGGHATDILGQIGGTGRAILVDRDQNAVDYLGTKFQNDPRVRIVHGDFLTSSKNLSESGASFDLILADLGLSSPHLDNPARGFSFQSMGPLDMRMDSRQVMTAAEVVNTWSEDALIRILKEYGEVYSARTIVRAIISARPIASTSDLAGIVRKFANAKKAPGLQAQVFQAIRIVVNDELGQLRESLPLWHSLLKPGGRLGVISFHSLEDRLVKQFFAEHGQANALDADSLIRTKRPIIATSEENVFNPRARSAKLRVLQRK
jgi:16S rRNA (cytosine1402-N4)-methyltransferase